MALPVRKSYKGAPVNTTLSALLGSGSTSCTVGSVTGWPTTFPFYIVIEPGTSREEKVKVTAATGTTLSITRAQDNTTDVEHPSASTVYPVFTAVEADEANQIASAMTTKGDLITTDGSSINRLAVGGTNTHVLQVDSTATNGIKWGQVATAGIADGAVTSAKIADGTIVNADIDASAAIALSKLATGALPTTITVASANLVDGTIVAADIADSAVTNAKLTGSTGTWTPVLTQSGSTITTTIFEARYYQIGRLMYVTAYFDVTGSGTAGFPPVINGLPVTAQYTSNGSGHWTISSNNRTFNVNIQSTSCYLQFDAGWSVPALANGQNIRFSATYMVA